jgi:hypothetical protein
VTYAGNWNEPKPLALPVDPFPVNEVLVTPSPAPQPEPPKEDPK